MIESERPADQQSAVHACRHTISRSHAKEFGIQHLRSIDIACCYDCGCVCPERSQLLECIEAVHIDCGIGRHRQCLAGEVDITARTVQDSRKHMRRNHVKRIRRKPFRFVRCKRAQVRRAVSRAGACNKS